MIGYGDLLMELLIGKEPIVVVVLVVVLLLYFDMLEQLLRSNH